MLTWREVWYYIRMLQRWWWLVILAIALPIMIAHSRTQNEEQYYVSTVTLTVGNNFTTAAPDPTSIELANTMAQFYREMLQREVVLGPVVEQLQLPLTWEAIGQMLKTRVNDRANLLEISITDTNPERAATIANTVAAQLISYSPNSQEKIAAESAALEQQIQIAKGTIDSILAKIQELRDREATLVSAYDITVLRDQIGDLETAYDEAQDTYLRLLDMRNRTTLNSLAVFEPAFPPGEPLPSKQTITIILAGIGGLLLAILAVTVLDRLDDRWRTGRELQDRLGVPDLGSIPEALPMMALSPSQAMRRERAMREAYTRILLAAMEHGERTLLISSPKPNKARSAFTVDLADFFTRSGHRVLIVDGEMLADTDLSVSYLSNLIGQEEHTDQPVVLHDSDVKMRSYLQPTPLENVTLLGRHIGPTDGPEIPMLPWPELVQNLRRSADVVIFDGPSVLNGADAALLAPLVDGVVLTLDPERNTRSDIIESKDRLLRRREAHLLGGVIVSGNGTAGELRSKRRQTRNDSSPQLLTSDAHDEETIPSNVREVPAPNLPDTTGRLSPESIAQMMTAPHDEQDAPDITAPQGDLSEAAQQPTSLADKESARAVPPAHSRRQSGPKT